MKHFLLLCWLTVAPAGAAEILFIAGPKSHAPGAHEHPAGCELLAGHLRSAGLPISAEVSQGWPEDPAKVAAADTLVIYSDGLAGHVAAGHLAELRKRHEAGKGLVVLHFALEPDGPEMAALLDDTIGGHFDKDWSVNPIWKMTAPVLGKHPVTRGVAPFEVEEEFYYHLRLRGDVTPVLQALPPADSLGTDGPRSGNPAVRKQLEDKVPQTLAWVVENSNKSRGFGFTGGHFHHHWANPDFRRLVLNAIVWTAGVEVPEGGVVSKVAAAPAYQTIDEAIAKGDLADVRLHIAADAKSLGQGARPTSRPPLEQAVMRNKTDVVIYLLEAGADPNTVNASKRTPLHLAVDRNNPVAAAALLKAGAKPNERDKEGWTPLHHAAAKNQLETGQGDFSRRCGPDDAQRAGRHPPARGRSKRRCGNRAPVSRSQGGSHRGLQAGSHRAGSRQAIQEPACGRRAFQVNFPQSAPRHEEKG
ncbi:MAG: ThuA domain-containing protein, partial [Luteolibacter sp.]